MTAVAWVLGLFGLLALWLAVARLITAHRLAAAGHVMLAMLLLSAAVVFGLVAADLGTYNPRVDDRPIADLFFEQVGVRRFRVTLTRLPGGRMQVFELAGDAWRVDVRTLDYGGWAGSIGGRPVYRLDRLVAVERVAEGATPAATNGFVLDAHDGVDLWRSVRQSGRWSDLLSAGYARSDELPMVPRSRFELRIKGEVIDVQPVGSFADASAPDSPQGP